ncbi:MAG: hypothetical protein KQJ78_15605 [Deltaproteobacteria bacterium]|nr:hypothetical protein [Deltaproteobacteria bacterium]
MALFWGGCSYTASVTNAVTSTFRDFWDSRDSGIRKRLAVAPFQTPLPQVGQPRASALGKSVMGELAQKGSLILIDYNQLIDMSQAEPPVKGDPREAMLVAARKLGLNAILSATITDLSMQQDLTGVYGFRENTPFLNMELDLTLVDVASGVILTEKAFREQVELTSIQATNINQGTPPPTELVDAVTAKLLEPATDWVTENLAAQRWAGYILEKKDNQYLITVGRDTGLPTGSKVRAYTPGQAIKTGSGQTVHVANSPVGWLVIGELMARTSWATPAPPEGEEKPGNFEVGQVLFSH